MSAIMQKYSVIGLMSGTSLDGVDIAYCLFNKDDFGNWTFSIEYAETIEYSSEWLLKLKNIEKGSVVNFIQIDRDYGTCLGNLCKDFIKKRKINPDFIASHGHTIFHQPHVGYTLQIGHGANIAAVAKLPVVSDFRSLDVALGGQGAPLVPIGDQLLFNNYNYCLNLGGFANISYIEQNKRIAFDICPVNMTLNYLSNLKGKSYDDKGFLAESGNLSNSLWHQLNNVPFYSQLPPKSLGKEWFENEILPLISNTSISVEDKLYTFCKHIAYQISLVLIQDLNHTLLITGGGTFNDFLIDCIKQQTSVQIIIPDKMIINFKEALIFAFLGVLRMTNQINCLSSVTGALKDNIGGAVYQY